jgi:hypothetical protein
MTHHNQTKVLTTWFLTYQSKKQLKFKIYLINSTRTSSLRHPGRSPGWRIVWAPSGSMSVQLLIGCPREPCRVQQIKIQT